MRAMTTVRIPIASGFDSLNVAAASAVALHRLARI
jgi:tRNA G18 (ribose-2'-O)-methylase SpoU